MESLVKRFSLIDIWGIFAPGAVLILALHFYTGAVTAPFTCFFQENAVMLAGYFIFVSYLAGSVLGQLGRFLEAAFPGYSKSCHRRCWDDTVRQIYLETLALEPPVTDGEMLKAGRIIYVSVQQGGRPERIVLLHALFSMHRALFFAMLIIIPLALFLQPPACPQYAGDGWTVASVCAVLAVLNLLRWMEFERKAVEESYLIFRLRRGARMEAAEAGQA